MPPMHRKSKNSEHDSKNTASQRRRKKQRVRKKKSQLIKMDANVKDMKHGIYKKTDANAAKFSHDRHSKQEDNTTRTHTHKVRIWKITNDIVAMCIIRMEHVEYCQLAQRAHHAGKKEGEVKMPL